MITLNKLNFSSKEPNKLHDYLLAQDMQIAHLRHDRNYDIFGTIIQEAKNIHITIPDEQAEACEQAIDTFLSIN